jgi:hypothetical protein
VEKTKREPITILGVKFGELNHTENSRIMNAILRFKSC